MIYLFLVITIFSQGKNGKQLLLRIQHKFETIEKFKAEFKASKLAGTSGTFFNGNGNMVDFLNHSSSCSRGFSQIFTVSY